MSVLLALGAAELLLRARRAARGSDAERPPLHAPCGDCGRVYGLNPDHPDVGTQGLRGEPHPPPGPGRPFRILFLGDSLVFGSEVARDSTFVRRLESELSTAGIEVETINAGALGYSIYNELHFYRERARHLLPDLVVVGFCMNDVVDPAAHWNNAGQSIVDVPSGAIPNPEYHEREILPRLRRARTRRKLSDRFALFDLLDSRILSRFADDLPSADETAWVELAGNRWPVYLTLEDNLSIEVLTDYESPEWRWLRGLYVELADEVRDRDGAGFAVIVFPLAYQLDAGYPFLPQELWKRFCRERSWPCLDLLPAVRAHPKEEIFRLDRSGYHDVWHLSRNGHRVVAKEVAEFLKRERLLPRDARPGAP